MARRFAKVSEEEIEEAFFYPSDLVNTKTAIPLRVASRFGIYPPLFTSPSGDSCMLLFIGKNNKQMHQFFFARFLFIFTHGLWYQYQVEH